MNPKLRFGDKLSARTKSSLRPVRLGPRRVLRIDGIDECMTRLDTVKIRWEQRYSRHLRTRLSAPLELLPRWEQSCHCAWRRIGRQELVSRWMAAVLASHATEMPPEFPAVAQPRLLPKERELSHQQEIARAALSTAEANCPRICCRGSKLVKL